MRYTTKTEYGLICMIYMARKGKSDTRVSIREISEKEKYSLSYLEKIFQALRHADLVLSHPGNQGGFSLARRPSEITLKDIIEALEGSTFDVFCAPKVREDIVCTHICMCGAKPVWKKTKELLDHFYESITLEMLAESSPAQAQHFIGALK